MSVGKKARSSLHVLTLMLTAFWLVATSRAREPAQDCFSPLGAPRVRLTLGPLLTPSGGEPGSCLHLDGLRDGSQVTLSVARSAARPEVRGPACWGYQVTAMEGVPGVSDLHAGNLDYAVSLMDVAASFSDRPEPGCAGQYRLRLEPSVPPAAGKLADPLRAGSGEAWRVLRSISFPTADACRPAASVSPQCQDSFEVRSIKRAP